MATRVAEVPRRGRGVRRYPWEVWFDGSVWELVQGEDFECTSVSMAGTAKNAGAIRNLHVDVARRGDRVYVQALR